LLLGQALIIFSNVIMIKDTVSKNRSYVKYAMGEPLFLFGNNDIIASNYRIYRINIVYLYKRNLDG